MRAGIIEQRHGRRCTGAKRCDCPWGYRVDAPATGNGRRRQLRKGGFPNKTSAREALADLQRRIAVGEQVGRTVTVQTFLSDWLDSKVNAGRKPSTLSHYRRHIDHYIVPVLGHFRLSELSATNVDALISKMQAQERGIPTQHRVLATLSSALGTAERRRLVPHNVCRQVDIAAEWTPIRPVYDPKGLAVFLESVAGHRLSALWRIYAVLGLRRGEALGLAWPALHLEAGTLTVERTLGVVEGKLTWGSPKTDRGRRTVALDAGTVKALRSHRATQNSEKLALGAGYDDHDLVFARENGAPLRPEWISKQFHVLTDAAGLPRIRLHDLRHSAATMALAAGVPIKVVSDNLGHSTITTTADVYSHVTTDLARESAEKVAAVLAAN